MTKPVSNWMPTSEDAGLLNFLLDKASWNKNKTVIGYLERNNIPYMFYPTNVTANKSHNSEKELLNGLESYWSKNPFKHNLLNYLSP